VVVVGENQIIKLITTKSLFFKTKKKKIKKKTKKYLFLKKKKKKIKKNKIK